MDHDFSDARLPDGTPRPPPPSNENLLVYLVMWLTLLLPETWARIVVFLAAHALIYFNLEQKK